MTKAYFNIHQITETSELTQPSINAELENAFKCPRVARAGRIYHIRKEILKNVKDKTKT